MPYQNPPPPTPPSPGITLIGAVMMTTAPRIDSLDKESITWLEQALNCNLFQGTDLRSQKLKYYT